MLGGGGGVYIVAVFNFEGLKSPRGAPPPRPTLNETLNMRTDTCFPIFQGETPATRLLPTVSTHPVVSKQLTVAAGTVPPGTSGARHIPRATGTGGRGAVAGGGGPVGVRAVIM